MFQCLQAIIALGTIFFSCNDSGVDEEGEESESKKCGNKFGPLIQKYSWQINVVIGTIFGAGHLSAMSAAGELEKSNIKVWFLAYTFLQAQTFVIYFIYLLNKCFCSQKAAVGEVELERKLSTLSNKPSGQEEEKQDPLG